MTLRHPHLAAMPARHSPSKAAGARGDPGMIRREDSPSTSRGSRLRGPRTWSVAPRLPRALSSQSAHPSTGTRATDQRPGAPTFGPADKRCSGTHPPLYSPRFIAVLEKVRVRGPVGRPRTRPDAVAADKAYSSRASRAYLRRRGIKAVIPEKADQAANRKKRGRDGGRPVAHDAEQYKERNTPWPSAGTAAVPGSARPVEPAGTAPRPAVRPLVYRCAPALPWWNRTRCRSPDRRPLSDRDQLRPGLR